MDGDRTDTGPVLCSGSPSGHRVLVSARCDGVSISTEPSGKTQRKIFVSETSPGRLCGHIGLAISDSVPGMSKNEAKENFGGGGGQWFAKLTALEVFLPI